MNDLLEAPVAPERLKLPRLSSARAEDIGAALRSAGCVVVENAMDFDMLARVNRALDPWFARAPYGEGQFFGRRTRRFSGVFAKAPLLGELALSPQILRAVEGSLLAGAHADAVQLSQTQAIEIAPGEPAQLLHRDDSVFPVAGQFELIVNVMWTLDPFTAKNGATRLAPGSHRWTRQLNEQYENGVFSAEAPAGSAIIWLGSLIHGGGANRSGAPRRGLVMSYSLAWLAQAEKLLLSTPVEAARQMPKRLQQLIGYQIHRPNLGWIEGRDPQEWLERPCDDPGGAQDNLTPLQAQMLQHYFEARLA